MSEVRVHSLLKPEWLCLFLKVNGAKGQNAREQIEAHYARLENSQRIFCPDRRGSIRNWRVPIRMGYIPDELLEKIDLRCQELEHVWEQYEELREQKGPAYLERSKKEDEVGKI